ncbi:hypothetical protein [Bradyrhizobium sp. URHC0002]
MTHFDLAKETLDQYAKLQPDYSSDKIDFVLAGGWGADMMTDEELKEAQKGDMIKASALLRMFESNLNLKPACSFWRLMMREIFDDNRTVTEVPNIIGLTEYRQIYEKMLKRPGDLSSGQPPR